MSKILLRSVLIILFFSPAITNAYTITIKVAGMKNQAILLGYYFGDKQYIKDSAKCDATGKVVFKGKDKLQGGIYLIASGDKKLLFDFVVTEQEFSLETDTIDFVKNMKIKGSPENEAFFAYSAFTIKMGIDATEAERKARIAKKENDTIAERKYREEIAKYDNMVKEYRKKVVKEHPTFLIAKIFKMMEEIEIPPTPILENGRKDSTFQYFYYRDHYFDNYDFTDDRIIYTPVFHPKMEAYITKIIIQIPDSINKAADFLISKAAGSKEISKYIIYWITNHYETSEFMGMDAVFVHMALTYYTDKNMTYWVDDALRFKITDRAETLNYNIIGRKAQNLIMPDSADHYQALYNIKAEYTVVLFWDANCGHCKEEVPKILSLYNIQNGIDTTEKANAKAKTGKNTTPTNTLKKVEVYAVGMTPEAKDWTKYISEHKLPWINVHDPNHESNFRKLYDVYSTPVIYLLDENKKIIAKRISAEQLKDFIERGLK